MHLSPSQHGELHSPNTSRKRWCHTNTHIREKTHANYTNRFSKKEKQKNTKAGMLVKLTEVQEIHTLSM